MPELFIIAGPNGAGKTTASLDLLPRDLHVFEYVNADKIAQGLNPLKPETADSMAGRVTLERLSSLREQKQNFGFETTLSGKTHAAFLRACIHQGYMVTLIFLWLPSADLAITRVKNRAKQGGHDIPAETIRRRFHKGLINLVKLYLPLCHRGVILDNTMPARKGELRPKIAEKLDGQLVVYQKEIWQHIVRESEHGNDQHER